MVLLLNIWMKLPKTLCNGLIWPVNHSFGMNRVLLCINNLYELFVEIKNTHLLYKGSGKRLSYLFTNVCTWCTQWTAWSIKCYSSETIVTLWNQQRISNSGMGFHLSLHIPSVIIHWCGCCQAKVFFYNAIGWFWRELCRGCGNLNIYNNKKLQQ